MIWRIEIKDKDGIFDSVGHGVLRDIADLGISSVKDVRVVQAFILEGELSRDDAQRVARELLVDGVVQD